MSSNRIDDDAREKAKQALLREWFGDDADQISQPAERPVRGAQRLSRWDTGNPEENAAFVVNEPDKEEDQEQKPVERHEARVVSYHPSQEAPPAVPRKRPATVRPIPTQTIIPAAVSEPPSPQVPRAPNNRSLLSMLPFTQATPVREPLNIKYLTLKQKLIEQDQSGVHFLLNENLDLNAALKGFIQEGAVEALNGYFKLYPPKSLPNLLRSQLRAKIETYATEDGENYLHLAAKKGCDDLLAFCLDETKLQVNAKNGKLETPLYLAYSNGKPESMLLLQHKSAEDERVTAMVRGEVFTAANAEPFSLPDFQIALSDATKFGFKLDEGDEKGNNLFHLFAKKKNKEALSFLIGLESHTYALNATNQQNETPLSILIAQNDVELIKLFKGTPATVCGNDNLKPLAFALHARAFNAADYFLQEAKTFEIDEAAKDKLSAIDIARKIEDSTIRLAWLPRLYARSNDVVKEVEEAIEKDDKHKARQLLNEGVALSRLNEAAQKKWQEGLMEEKYNKEIKDWQANPRADHPEIILLSDYIKALAEGRNQADKELQVFITHLYVFRDELRAEIDGLRAQKEMSKLSFAAINALPPLVRAKQTSQFVKKLLDAEKNENLVEKVINQSRLNAIKEFEAKFKRTWNWKSYAKALGVLILSALTFVGVGALALMGAPLMGVSVPLYAAATSASVAALSVFGIGMFAISRRPHLTKQGLQVVAKGREFVEASQREVKPLLSS